MVMSNWKTFGASVRGPGHIRSGLPNQDALKTYRNTLCEVAVVSDGVGSLRTPEYGSKAACRAVIRAARNWKQMDEKTDLLLAEIHQNWLAEVEPFSPEESSATCLFVIRPKQGKIVVGMLGDGLAAILRTDGSYEELIDNKEDNFSNQTAALSRETKIIHWKTLLMDQDECCAVVLCTDGVADDLLPDKRADFVRNLYAQGQNFAVVTLVRGVRKMLENWSVPKHSDDKTLVCMCRQQEGI